MRIAHLFWGLVFGCSWFFLRASAQDLGDAYHKAQSTISQKHVSGQTPRGSGQPNDAESNSGAYESSPAQIKALELSREGLYAFNQKNYELAIEDYQQALQYSPNDSDLRRALRISMAARAIVLANNLEDKGDWDGAEAQWATAYELDSDAEWINQRLTEARSEQEKIRQERLSATRMRDSLAEFTLKLSPSSSTISGLDFTPLRQDSDKSPSEGLLFMNPAKIAKQENEKQRRWDSERLRPYTAKRIEPPTPRVAKSQVTCKGIQISLSGQASHFVDIVKELTAKLPQPTRERIRAAVFDQIFKHLAPEHAQVVRDITGGTADDMKNVLESLKGTIKELASPELDGAHTRQTVDSAEAVAPNTGKRISDQAKDKAIDSIKNEIDKLARSSEDAPER